jgi:hypothetical protein
MARYGKSLYNAERYGNTPDTPNLLWGLEIDWDDDGLFSGENEAVRVRGIHVSRGRDSFISYDGGGFEPQQVGQAVIDLENSDYRFDPYNSSSPLFGQIEPGKLARLSVRNGASGTRYSVITGVVQNIIPSGRTAQLVLNDGWSLLNVTSSRADVYQNYRADQLIDLVLTDVNWTLGKDLQEAVYSPRYWWGTGGPAIDVIRSLADNEFGLVWMAADGTFKFRNRRDTPASVLSISQDQLLRDISTPMPWETKRNIVEVSFSPVTTNSGVTLWEWSGSLSMMPGQTRIFEAVLKSTAVDITTITKSMNWHPDGIGTDLTYALAVSVVRNGSHATVTATNTSTIYQGYITQLGLIGTEATRGDAVVVSATSDGYERRPRKLSVSPEWLSDTDEGQRIAEGLRDMFERVSILPVVQIEARPDIQFIPDLYDTVTLSIPAKGINNQRFRVGKIEHEALDQTCQAVRTTLRLEPFFDYDQNYWTFPTQLGVTSILGW